MGSGKVLDVLALIGGARVPGAGSEEPFMLGILAGGQQSWIPWARRLRDEPGLALLGLADRQSKRAFGVATAVGVPMVFDSLEQMIGQLPLDGVIIVVPPEEQAEAVIEALRHGLHVLCDEPFGTSAEEARRMIEAAGRADRVLASAFLSRLQGQEAIGRVRGGDAIGSVQSVEGKWYRRGSDFVPGVADRPGFWDLRADGPCAGPLASLLAVVLPMLGSPVSSVQALVEPDREWDSLVVNLEIGGALAARLTCSQPQSGLGVAPNESRDADKLFVSCTGTEGTLKLPAAEEDSPDLVWSSHLITRSGGDERGHAVERAEFVRLDEVRGWIRACRGGAEPSPRPHDAHAVQVVLDGARASAANDGRPVRL